MDEATGGIRKATKEKNAKWSKHITALQAPGNSSEWMFLEPSSESRRRKSKR
jgi:hypothetical protein